MGSDDPTDGRKCSLGLRHRAFGREGWGNSWVGDERPERRTQLTYIFFVLEPECQPQEQTQGPMNKGSDEEKCHSWRYDSKARGCQSATRNMCGTKMHYIYETGNHDRSNRSELRRSVCAILSLDVRCGGGSDQTHNNNTRRLKASSLSKTHSLCQVGVC